MTGFIKGLFGSKGQAKETSVERSAPKPTAQDSTAYFLDMDDARTMGNAEYMRTAKKTRRTFPKTVDNQITEFEQEVSSVDAGKDKAAKKVAESNGAVSMNGASADSVSGSVPSDAEVRTRRASDSSLDMFRNMAKDIRK